MSVSVAVEGSLAWVTVHRPEARNAMTFAMYEAFHEACERLDGDPQIKVMVVRGGGGTFIAGTDIGEFTSLRTAEDALAYERRMDRLSGRLKRMTKVTIAMIEGYATGGGFALVLACDLRYAAANARLGIPIARTLGNCLSMANYACLVDAVGPLRAKDLLFTARLVSAHEAQALGLISGVAAHEDLERHVREQAEAVSRHAPLTLQITKEAIRRIQERHRAADGDDLIVRAYTSEDFREGVRAFLDKRTPLWQGR
jgi:enoyl-CoA hydratase/carnithine racemase